MAKEVRVAELFAGVGGFRIGLERASNKFKTVWSNQWEPASKKQFASEIYSKRFSSEGHSNVNISDVPVKDIPDHDLLVGGFPCQDYSVARVLSQSKGLEGKKGVLWWDIHRILSEKKDKPAFLFLENVDRLLKSPAKQRGRDFAIMLASLSDLGYIVEWRVINAADYGMPQRRRRVFFLGYHKNSEIHKEIVKSNPVDWISEKGIIANAFKIKRLSEESFDSFKIEGDLADISINFNKDNPSSSPFNNSGIMIDRKIWTAKTSSDYFGPFAKLGDVLVPDSSVPKEFFIDGASLEKWKYLKGAKNEERTNKAHGTTYHYSEGAMVFPDPLDSPSRTIVTGEGGSSASRFKHIIKTKDGRLRRLTPLELERLNMFPDNHTEGVSDIKRAFIMGNALVVGVVERIGSALASRIA